MEIEDFYQIREDFHRHPELSGKEKETARRVADLLKGMQPTHLYTGIGGHKPCFSGQTWMPLP